MLIMDNPFNRKDRQVRKVVRGLRRISYQKAWFGQVFFGSLIDTHQYRDKDYINRKWKVVLVPEIEQLFREIIKPKDYAEFIRFSHVWAVRLIEKGYLKYEPERESIDHFNQEYRVTQVHSTCTYKVREMHKPSIYADGLILTDKARNLLPEPEWILHWLFSRTVSILAMTQGIELAFMAVTRSKIWD